MTFQVQSFFDKETATWTHVVWDPKTLQAAVVDPVLDYDPFSARTSHTAMNKIVEFFRTNGLVNRWFLETHIHADHLTAAHALRGLLGGDIVIGKGIQQVVEFWAPLFALANYKPQDYFQHLVGEGDTLALGDSFLKVWETPGHTPACVCYVMESSGASSGLAFVGDTLFLPDIGTARADFPGADATTQYHSLQRLLALPESTQLFVGHDYPPSGSAGPSRGPEAFATVKQQRENNILARADVTEQTYVQTRQAKDQGKPVPKLVLPALQVNLYAGNLEPLSASGRPMLHIPLNSL